MIHLTSSTRILIAVAPVDFRRQIDGLVALCQSEFGKNPRDGVYYVFINRAKTMVRLLSYDGQGYWLATKRLSRGRFKAWPCHGDQVLCPMVSRELSAMIKSTASQF